jgi:histidyl-tRNA synthetase
MSELITPRVLKGFRDSLPEAEIDRKNLTDRLEMAFRGFGFVPIDTPALEYSEILLRKSGGETEKQVYRFTDNGARDVALRFDLTVPFARFMAEHWNELYLPFKRYHIAKVWRGENTQRGRYREFFQCDFDIVGSDCAAADFEILLLIQASMEILGVNKFCVRLSHRGIFNRFLDRLGVRHESMEILRIVDKLGKAGEEEVLSLLEGIAGKENAKAVLSYCRGEGDFLSTLAAMEKASGGVSEESTRLRVLYSSIKEIGIEGFFILDPSITRGLDYYTGIVYETFLDEMPEIGSVCSGGR